MTDTSTPPDTDAWRRVGWAKFYDLARMVAAGRFDEAEAVAQQALGPTPVDDHQLRADRCGSHHLPPSHSPAGPVVRPADVVESYKRGAAIARAALQATRPADGVDVA